MFPNSSIDHSVASMHLIMQLVGQLPDDLEVIRAVDVNLELAPPDKPGHVRRPDLFVAQRQNTEDGLIKASEIVLVVEILSWSSRDTDTVAKRREYAKAGIPFYWIIDLEEQVSLAPMRLAGESGYQEMPVETGVYEADAPFPLKIQVDRLTY